MSANVPSSASGTVTLGMAVAQIAQEQEDDHHDQADGQRQGELHVVDRRPDRRRAVAQDVDLDRRGIAACEPRQACLIWSTVSITLAPGCLKTTSSTAGLLFAQAASLWFSGPSTAWPMSRTRTARAVA